VSSRGVDPASGVAGDDARYGPLPFVADDSATNPSTGCTGMGSVGIPPGPWKASAAYLSLRALRGRI